LSMSLWVHPVALETWVRWGRWDPRVSQAILASQGLAALLAKEATMEKQDYKALRATRVIKASKAGLARADLEALSALRVRKATSDPVASTAHADLWAPLEPLVLKAILAPKAYADYLVLLALLVLEASAALLVFLERRVSQAQLGTSARPVLKVFEASRAKKASADPRDLQVATEQTVLQVNLDPTELPVLQASQARPAPLGLLVPLLLLLYLRCLLALASSTAWCALLSTVNQLQAPPYHWPGMAL